MLFSYLDNINLEEAEQQGAFWVLDNAIIVDDIVIVGINFKSRYLNKMKKYIFALFIFTLSTFLFLSKTPKSFASIIFQDSFNGGINTSHWTVNSQFFTTSSFGIQDTSSHGQYTDMLTNNISYVNDNETQLQVKISNNDPSAFNIFCRNGNGGVTGFQFYPAGNGNTLDTYGSTDTANYSWDNSNGTHSFDAVCNGSTLSLKEDGNSLYNDTHTYQVGTGTASEFTFGDGHTSEFANFTFCDVSGCSTANTIAVSPSTSTATVGTPFNVTVAVTGGAAFNAAQAHVTVSSNLSITGIHSAPSPACNLQYTQTPTTSDPSFAGAIYGSSSTNCKVYTLTLTPNAAGAGTITVTNGSIKSYADNSEILTSVTNGSYTINAANATPTPTPALSGLTITSPTETYHSTYTLTGTKDASTTTVFVNGSSTGVTYPTSTTWQATETLTLGANNTAGSNTFTVYGTDGNGNQTATISTTVSLHELGDINGDGTVDLTDASLFAVDWGKTSNLTYLLSDMNDDGNVDLTDLSILAKLIAQ